MEISRKSWVFFFHFVVLVLISQLGLNRHFLPFCPFSVCFFNLKDSGNIKISSSNVCSLFWIFLQFFVLWLSSVDLYLHWLYGSYSDIIVCALYNVMQTLCSSTQSVNWEESTCFQSILKPRFYVKFCTIIRTVLEKLLF